MIARIAGKVIEKGRNYLVVAVGGVSYEVFLPETVMQRLEANISGDGTINLITYHYLQMEPSKGTPVLIGFLNEVEKEFFEIFITVSGIGPRAALKALNQPISLIARAIDEADINFLRSLPGIGQQRAREIVAKLQNKVGKFGLIQDGKVKEQKAGISDIEKEALTVLTQLEYKKSEAAEMIKKALQRSPDIQTTEELLNEIYKERKLK
ncbi:MAG: Holliday junction DNA helicase RuvA [Candidatus Omnitrophica bacterium]|nr:Holliday junction DNA helicase RuvA [Candidatus Omnitrophota bacterium]MCG2706888.1 helix-hairpin-helix domain-containing protein [Candidatus Omnitrophota bacterium]